MNLEVSFSMVIDQIAEQGDGAELTGYFKSENENIVYTLKSRRDRMFITNEKVILVDYKGLSEKNKEFLILPFSKITSINLKTTGVMKSDSVLFFFIPVIGVVKVEFGKDIPIKKVFQYLSSMIGNA